MPWDGGGLLFLANSNLSWPTVRATARLQLRVTAHVRGRSTQGHRNVSGSQLRVTAYSTRQVTRRAPSALAPAPPTDRGETAKRQQRASAAPGSQPHKHPSHR